MPSTRLYQFFKDKGISPQQVADATGYSYNYIVELLRGTEPLSAAAKFRLLEAYPETSLFLLDESVFSVETADTTAG